MERARRADSHQHSRLCRARIELPFVLNRPTLLSATSKLGFLALAALLSADLRVGQDTIMTNFHRQLACIWD